MDPQFEPHGTEDARLVGEVITGAALDLESLHEAHVGCDNDHPGLQ